MNNTFTSSMFDSIKSALTKTTETNTNTKYKDILRTTPGNTYVVRLLPNIKDPNKTFFNYYSYGWNSFSTGQFVTCISPATWGQRDPISETFFSIRRNGSEEEKEKSRALNRKENWFVNIYVVNDPVTPENNGTIKVLRFGRQLNKIIMDAIEGDDAVDFGPRIFDLSPNGCNLRIKVEKQGDYPTFVSSKFALPSEIKDLSPDSYEEIYNNINDLESYVSTKSYDELVAMLNEHYHCSTDVAEEVQTPTPVAATPTPKITTTPKKVTPAPVQESTSASIDDESIAELLKGLE
jgi:gp32 DNA binding protein like